jgi:Zn finger protein HypA/HybF involved in hydrogenase expression
MEKICLNCGKVFRAKLSRIKYCSLECAWENHRKKFPLDEVSKFLDEGLPLEQIATKYNTSVDALKRFMKRNRLIIVRKIKCAICGQLFEANLHRGRIPKYCKACRARSADIYYDKLRKEKQRLIQEKFGGRCYICGRQKGKLELHHIYYEHDSPSSSSSSYDKLLIEEIKLHPERFILLCHFCHSIVTTLEKNKTMWIKLNEVMKLHESIMFLKSAM